MTTTRDVHDMLGIKADLNPKPKSKKKSKPTLKRPDHITRELFQLLGERAAPLQIAGPAEQYKAKRKAAPIENVRWRTTPFHVSAREDGLLLRHWRKELLEALPKQEQEQEQEQDAEQENLDPASDAMDTDDDEGKKEKRRERSSRRTLARMEQNMKDRTVLDQGQSAVKESKFAQYSVGVDRPTYDDDALYDRELASETWSREETDYLIDLYAEYYGKWHLIWDRYTFRPAHSDIPPTQRSMEDLKARFYTVSAASMIAQTPLQSMTTTQFSYHEKLTRYNPARETERKAQKARLLQRSKADRDEERILLAELDRIYKRHAETEAEGRDLRARLDTGLTRDKEDALAYTSSAEINGLLQKMFQKDREARQQQARRMQASGQFLGAPSTSAHGNQQQRDKRASLVSGPTLARQNISAATEARFGVKTFEKVQSGVSFKSDRERKARVAKSAAKTEKIAAILGELGVPEMLQLPTDEVCKGLENVVQKVLELIEKRRVLEREENDLKVEEQKKILDEGGDLGGAEKAVQNTDDAEGDEEEEDEQIESTQMDADGEADELSDAEGELEDADPDDAEGEIEEEGSEINEEEEEESEEEGEEEEEEEEEEVDEDEEEEEEEDDGDVSIKDAVSDEAAGGMKHGPEDDKDEPAVNLQLPKGASSRKRSVSVLSAGSGTSRGSRAQSKRRRA